MNKNELTDEQLILDRIAWTIKYKEVYRVTLVEAHKAANSRLRQIHKSSSN